jgi:hypothetical protein
MKERRYSQYKQEDVFIQFIHSASVLKVEVLGAIVGASVSLIRTDTNKRLRAVVLARSSDWYRYSLNYPLWQHGCTAVVAGTHDSCLPVPVLALDAMKWYKKHELRDIFGPLQPRYDANDQPIPDTFDQARKSHYGHNMLIGALMCGREDAIARLQTFRPRTRYRIEAELRNLHARRQGRPLVVGPDPNESKTKEAAHGPARPI